MTASVAIAKSYERIPNQKFVSILQSSSETQGSVSTVPVPAMEINKPTRPHCCRSPRFGQLVRFNYKMWLRPQGSEGASLELVRWLIQCTAAAIKTMIQRWVSIFIMIEYSLIRILKLFYFMLFIYFERIEYHILLLTILISSYQINYDFSLLKSKGNSYKILYYIIMLYNTIQCLTWSCY